MLLFIVKRWIFRGGGKLLAKISSKLLKMADCFLSIPFNFPCFYTLLPRPDFDNRLRNPPSSNPPPCVVLNWAQKTLAAILQSQEYLWSLTTLYEFQESPIFDHVWNSRMTRVWLWKIQIDKVQNESNVYFNISITDFFIKDQTFRTSNQIKTQTDQTFRTSRFRYNIHLKCPSRCF